MHFQQSRKSVICFICSLVATIFATSMANADDALLHSTALVNVQNFSYGELDLTLDGSVETGQERISDLHLPEPRSQVVSFVKKCAELDAIPLFEFAEQEDKHVYLGINFEGFLGVYARL